MLCCYTALNSSTALQLHLYVPQVELIDVTGRDTGYWEELTRRWRGKHSLAVIEQDIKIHAGVLPSFAACGEPWCVYAYTMFRDPPERLIFGLGCAKFSRDAQRLADLSRIKAQFRHWQYLDGEIAAILQGAGLAPHVHGDVAHHHGYEVRARRPPPETIRLMFPKAVR